MRTATSPVSRAWRAGDVVDLDLPMAPRLTASHPRIDATRGSVAIERGPLVYCLESPDQPGDVNLMDVAIARDAAMDVVWADKLGGMMAINVRGQVVDSAAWGDDLYRPLDGAAQTDEAAAHLVAIPYYAWDNRGLTAMRVWIPLR